MSETVVKASYLTQEAFDRLKAELEQLSGPGRADIVAKIEAAREEGDLKENGGYHAAREEQGKMEARIRQLTQLLEQRHHRRDPGGRRRRRARHGRHRRDVRRGGDLPPRVARDRRPRTAGLQRAVPIGSAVNGKQAGDSASYSAPNGKKIDVKILSAKPYAS